MEVQLPTFFSSTLDKREWLASRTGHFIPGTHKIWGFVGPQRRSGCSKKRENSIFPYGKPNPNPRPLSNITDTRELTAVENRLTFILLTWRIWWVPNNASKWQMGFNSAFKGLIYSAFGKSLCTYKRRWKWCPQASIQASTRLILFANTFCRSACKMFLMYAVIAVFNSLTFKNRASYIQDGRTATLQMLHFIYIFSTNISTEYFNP